MKTWTLDNDKGTYLDKIGNARCTLEFDNFWHERLMIVTDTEQTQSKQV